MSKTKEKNERILGRFTLEILESLEKPKRFVDLAGACSNEKTRAQKLKELINMRLISTTIMYVKGRRFIHYMITYKGRKVLQDALKLKRAIKQ